MAARQSIFKRVNIYTDGWEHLADEFRLLDLRINALLARQRQNQGEGLFDRFKGLVVSEEEVQQLLDGSPAAGLDGKEFIAIREQAARMESVIEERRRLSLKKRVFLPLAHISQVFGLTPFEERLLVICLAAALDRKYEKLYAYLQDDVTRKSPTLDLAVKLLGSGESNWAESRLFLAARGRMRRLMVQNMEQAEAGGSLLSRSLKIEPRVISFILHPDRTEESLHWFLKVINPWERMEPLVLGEELQKRLQGFTEANRDDENRDKGPAVFYLWGPPGVGKKLQVKHLCRNVGQTLIVVDLEKIVSLEAPFSETIQKVVREAILRQAAVCFSNCQVLQPQITDTGGEGGNARSGASLYRYLHETVQSWRELPGRVFMLSDSPFRHPDLVKDFLFIEIELTVPSELEREMLWKLFSQGYVFSDDIDWGAMAGKFNFTPGQIKRALVQAGDDAAWRSPGQVEIETETLHQACFSQGRHNLGQKAIKVNPRYTWEDIVLPPETKEQLRNGCNQIKYRSIVYDKWGFGNKLAYGKGLTMLFSGPPGTGKTMAAQVMANELNLELYKIDLSQVISKYIGETEKNLQQIFNEARYSNAILFFDEADALFGKRSEVKDAHDRYANIETSYLLQKVEEYEGVSILATNLMKNLDEAFRRRLNYLVEFPFPDPEYREKIWRSMFPRETPVGRDVEFELLAKKLEIAGGNIKNIVVAAAFLAAEVSEPVGMEHIVRAARYELQKIGLTMLKKDIDGLLG